MGCVSFSKKGAGHFEMIISFVFFVGFVSFMLFTVAPYDDSERLVGPVMEGFYDAFVENVSTDLTTMFLWADSTGLPGPCFEFEISGEVFDYLEYGVAFDSAGAASRATAEISGENVVIKVNEHGFLDTYTILFSSSVPGGPLSCTLLASDKYSVGNVEQRMVLLNSSLFAMEAEYETNYEALREKMKIPFIYDFSITNTNFPELNMERNIPSDVDVYVEEYKIDILYWNGAVSPSTFILKIW